MAASSLIAIVVALQCARETGSPVPLAQALAAATASEDPGSCTSNCDLVEMPPYTHHEGKRSKTGEAGITTLPGCQAACLKDASCVQLTFANRSVDPCVLYSVIYAFWPEMLGFTAFVKCHAGATDPSCAAVSPTPPFHCPAAQAAVTNCSACGFQAMCESADTPGCCVWCPGDSSGATLTRLQPRATAADRCVHYDQSCSMSPTPSAASGRVPRPAGAGLVRIGRAGAAAVGRRLALVVGTYCDRDDGLCSSALYVSIATHPMSRVAGGLMSTWGSKAGMGWRRAIPDNNGTDPVAVAFRPPPPVHGCSLTSNRGTQRRWEGRGDSQLLAGSPWNSS